VVEDRGAQGDGEDWRYQVVNQAVLVQVPCPEAEVEERKEEQEVVKELVDVQGQDLVVLHFLQSVSQNDHHDRYASKRSRASESQSPHSSRTRLAELLR
jgi:hypothetical protein